MVTPYTPHLIMEQGYGLFADSAARRCFLTQCAGSQHGRFARSRSQPAYKLISPAQTRFRLRCTWLLVSICKQPQSSVSAETAAASPRPLHKVLRTPLSTAEKYLLYLDKGVGPGSYVESRRNKTISAPNRAAQDELIRP